MKVLDLYREEFETRPTMRRCFIVETTTVIPSLTLAQ